MTQIIFPGCFLCHFSQFSYIYLVSVPDTYPHMQEAPTHAPPLLLFLVLWLHCGKAWAHLTALWVQPDSVAFCMLCDLSQPWHATGLQVCRAVRWLVGWEGPWALGSRGRECGPAGERAGYCLDTARVPVSSSRWNQLKSVHTKYY